MLIKLSIFFVRKMQEDYIKKLETSTSQLGNSIETLKNKLIEKLQVVYSDKYDRLDDFEKIDWQIFLHPNHSTSSTYQKLPEQSNASIPPLEDFPVSPGLSQINVRLKQPYQRHGAIRRDCFLFFYLPVDCPAGQNCSNWFCLFSHSTLEKMFHPLIYRTEKCRRGIACFRAQCSFLHTIEDDVEANNLWIIWEKFWLGYRKKPSLINDELTLSTSNPKECTKLRNAINIVTSIRLSRINAANRASLRELFAVLEMEKLNTFELKIMCQPLNYILNHNSMKKAIDIICKSFKKFDNYAYFTARVNSNLTMLMTYWDTMEKNYTENKVFSRKDTLISSDVDYTNTKHRDLKTLPSRMSISSLLSTSGDKVSCVSGITAYSKTSSDLFNFMNDSVIGDDSMKMIAVNAKPNMQNMSNNLASQLSSVDQISQFISDNNLDSFLKNLNENSENCNKIINDANFDPQRDSSNAVNSYEDVC